MLYIAGDASPIVCFSPGMYNHRSLRVWSLPTAHQIKEYELCWILAV